VKKVALHIDEYACWGCKTCEVACKQEHHQPDGINYVYVTEDGPKSVNGKLDFIYRLNVCQHCDTPLCAGVCPEKAIVKRGDGIVVLDTERCTGCQACVDACSFRAITFNRAEGTAQKCNLCSQRVDHGLYPACADNICLAHCIYFGDPAEIEKKVLKNRKGRTDLEK
jgi:Fe-S-cluster-containing dehydrogenase component